MCETLAVTIHFLFRSQKKVVKIFRLSLFGDARVSFLRWLPLIK